jgi:hypothetical protein
MGPIGSKSASGSGDGSCMRTSHYFLIESAGTRHELILDGDLIAIFSTREAAESEANRIANQETPGVKLRFELDMKSTLNNLEIRGATFDADKASASPVSK